MPFIVAEDPGEVILSDSPVYSVTQTDSLTTAVYMSDESVYTVTLSDEE